MASQVQNSNSASRERRPLPRLRVLLLTAAITFPVTGCGSDTAGSADESMGRPRASAEPTGREPLYSPPTVTEPVGPDYDQTYSVDSATFNKILDVYQRALQVGNGSVSSVNYTTLETSMPNACQALSPGATAAQFAQLAQQKGIESNEALGVLAIALQTVCPELDNGVGATFPGGKTASQFLYDPT